MHPMRPVLEEKVIKTSMCTACGGCAAICPVRAISMNENTATIDHTCIGCIWCDFVCPVLESHDKEVGYYKEALSAKSEFTGQDGGLTQAILHVLFEKNEIDCVVGVGHDEEWKPIPMIVDSPEDLSKLAFSKYTYTPLLETLTDAVKKDYKRIAVTGVGCQAASAALFRENFPEYGRIITCVIGLICTKTFRHEDFFGFLKKQGFSPTEISKIDIRKGIFYVEGSSKRFEEKVRKLGHLSRVGCEYCDDVPAFSSDIALGAVGSEPGYNTVIIRSYEGKRIWDNVKTSLPLTLGEAALKPVARLQIMKRREVKSLVDSK
ncbi:MAG: Coenzyme F420 hydrogenase/dehydrogenase, beta subunit C-terminal domain [Candidatus Hodarchaeales archaeon]